MTDIVSPAVRSQMMSGIRGKNTRPEVRVRQLLHRLGYRFRLHRKDLPGSPDLVLPRHRLAVFVHGCFWHMHAGCRFSKMPGTRTDFWLAKLERNRERDRSTALALEAAGWRVLVIWECLLRQHRSDDELSALLAAAVEAEDMYGELTATVPPTPQESDAPQRRRTGKE